MAKRGYKLQEFVAHSTNVNCLSIGKKACRLFITGGDDNKVNVWAIGKPTSLMSLCGHASPVESVAFDTAEVLVLAGASSGVIKLWDLEESKMVRTLPGHKSDCTAVEFHPFGEFFASGSMDTNLRIWDIRKKGCIHTYKGHTQGISTIRFTPDGRWVVSGGFDNVVKVWDLTAGKLLHDFKYHEGHIRSIDFHPLEFLLATGSADTTVKFWDLETFELIGSSRPEATGVRSICFHPDGRTLFCGLDDSLKVYSWEPVIYHDAVDMGWSTLGDLCIHEGKLMGCSYYRNSVGVWVADISFIKPYGDDFASEGNECTEQNLKLAPTSSEKLGSGVRSISDLRSKSPDFDTKEIKNIYVDSTGRNPLTSHGRTLVSPRVSPPLDGEKIHNQVTEKRSEANTDASGNTLDKSFVVPSVVPRESNTAKESSNFGMGAISFSRTRPGMLLRPAHLQQPSNSKIDVEKLVVATESRSFCKDTETALTTKMQCLTVSDDDDKRSCEEEGSNTKTVTEKFEKALSPDTPSDQGSCDSSLTDSDGIASIKIVNGVAVVAGRTRSLVERFERRKKVNDGDQATDVTPLTVPVTYKSPSTNSNITLNSIPEIDAEPSIISNINPVVMEEPDETPTISSRIIPCVPTVMDISVTLAKPKACSNTSDMNRTQPTTHSSVPNMDRTRPITPTTVPDLDRTRPVTRNPVPDLDRTRPITCNTVTDMGRTPALATTRTYRPSAGRERMHHPSTIMLPPRVIRELDRTTPTPQKEEPQSSGRDTISDSLKDVTEDVMQGHDIFLSTVKSRLTKLQMIRHFWERSDIKGAINAMRRLPDPSVKADVVSVIAEKMDILNLDLFSRLLPVLVSLLDCNVERYSSLSMEMLLKLVAVFGPVIRSTISAPPPVGVDLHAEERIEWCNRCSIELQKIQQVLPVIISKGGTLAKSAQELSLVLQVS